MFVKKSIYVEVIAKPEEQSLFHSIGALRTYEFINFLPTLCLRGRLTDESRAAFTEKIYLKPGMSSADSTWDTVSVYALLATLNGASVLHTAKLLNLIVDSSMESEAIATSKAGELIAYIREILRALGVPPQRSTFIGTDNLANQLIASGRSQPSRARHCIRRYTAFLQRVTAGDVEVGHVRDVDNPADFMTKMVPKEKIERSLDYATNRRNAVQ